MYIDAPRSLSSTYDIDLLLNGFQNDKPKSGDDLLSQETFIFEGMGLHCGIDENLVQLNYNNNSNTWDPRDIRTITSKSFSIIAQGSNREKTKTRWTTNRPRSVRAKRSERPTKQVGRTNVLATQSFVPRNNGGNTGSKEEFSKSAVSGSSCAKELLDFHHLDIVGNEEAIHQTEGDRTKKTEHRETVTSGFQAPKSFASPRPQIQSCAPPPKTRSGNAYVDLQQMLNEISSYQRMTDVPESLKQELVNTICKPLIGSKSRSEVQTILGQSETKKVTITDGDVYTRAGAKSVKHAPEGPADKSCLPEGPQDMTTDSLVPFSTDHVFNQLFGRAYKRAYSYWQVRPPLLPSHVFQYKTTVDGAPFVIGAGTFGEVAVAWLHINVSRRQVAIKEPFSDLVSRDKVFDEAKITMYLEPTGFVPLCYGLVLDNLGGNFGIVLELFGSGITLKDILSEKNLSRLHWLSISRQLAEGLSRIHGMDILVNDIKPDNVLVDLSTPEPVVKFCDMGCASYRCGISYDDANLDIFTHLAPEVKAGGQTSKASDVYGLGKLLDRIVQVSVISGLVPVSEKCMFMPVLNRATSSEALAMLNSVFAAEIRCLSGPDVEESESSGFQSSVGYDPDQDLTSGMCTQSDFGESRPAVFEVTPATNEGVRPKVSPNNTYLLLNNLAFDKVCVCVFLILSVLIMAFSRVA